jgi:hypothetical protein
MDKAAFAVIPFAAKYAATPYASFVLIDDRANEMQIAPAWGRTAL